MHRRIVPDIVSNQKLTVLPPETTVREAARMMADRHIGAVLVGENNHLSGIFTERDVLTRVVAKNLDPAEAKLRDVMTSDPDTVAPDNTAIEALELMRKREFRHLPVVDGDTIVGIVSIRDLYAAVKSELEDDLVQREAFMFGTGYGPG